MGSTKLQSKMLRREGRLRARNRGGPRFFHNAAGLYKLWRLSARAFLGVGGRRFLRLEILKE